MTISFVAHAQLNIVTTTGMIADLTKNIGGQHVKVTALMGTGVDPHLYKATQGDLRRLVNADLILYNGLHLEGKLQTIFEKMARKKPVFAISALISEKELIHHDNNPDPHIWFDIALWQKAGERVLQILSTEDPTHQKAYAQNAQAYLTRLQQLHQWVRSEIQRIPESRRILITAHDAFGYFGQAYDIKVMGLQGVSTASEFGLQDIRQLKEIIVKQQVQAVFVESSVSPRFIDALVKGVEAEGTPLKIGGELYSDAMGLANTPEGTYIGMVKHNVSTIVNALK
ncbi:Manganese ABC transporter, periplasmic-binding protein SitA [hydrothermal vent metagenome]|uniref:Manganese ABC transporter, periplasmic-binding protein SitA n=1 Tax=hydrothermal vent metagenome TaxID=652676 RepID=A0A3B0W6B8_9ZZZZ